jgi:hypothetical protein
MSEQSRRFPHIELQFAAQGDAVSPRSFPRERNPTTQAKLGDRGGHGSALKSSVSGIVSG